MGHLKVVGQHKGSVQLDVQTATVLDLKQAVSRSSGLAVAGLKLLAGWVMLKSHVAAAEKSLLFCIFKYYYSQYYGCSAGDPCFLLSEGSSTT